MSQRTVATAVVSQCESCRSVFLDRGDLGALVEAENDWHAHRSAHTAPVPRITADMTAPPRSAPPSRSFLDAVFKG